ncbi:tetratricopeptide repeat protein [Micromonospora musae]|uniref:tetratricopeptide repeat protein n=1 Tax=Micromonospora musae TaxID=1894970 RepID=UPI0033CE58A5
MKILRSIGILAAGVALLTAVPACSDDAEAPAATPTVAASTQVDAAALVDLGIEQGKSGDIDQAKATFEQVLAADSDNKFAWFNIGYIAQSRNQVEDAITHYDKALSIDPEFRPALYNKAIAVEASDVRSAIDLYRKILSLDKRASTAHVRLGMLLSEKGDKEGAKDAFSAAVDIDAKLVDVIPGEYR